MSDLTRGLYELIDRLAGIDREWASAGERQAAGLIAAELRAAGASATVEIERVHGTYWWPLGITSAAGILASALGARGHRRAAGALGGLAALAVVDDVGVGRRWLRRLLPHRPTANVVAVTGDPDATSAVVLVSHHDAAHTGTFFDPRIRAVLTDRLRVADEGIIEQIPVMLPIVLAPATVAAAAALGCNSIRRLGSWACAGIIASFVDMAVRSTVPGANDNLTGVAVLVAVARALATDPIRGLRVVLLSTGSEESLMEGMEAFGRRHFPSLPPGRTVFVCVDTVGSPTLLLPEAEGMLHVRHYDERLKALITSAAAECGVEPPPGTPDATGH